MDTTVAALSTEVRRLKRMIWCLAALFPAILAMAASREPVRDSITVRQLHVIDANGIERVRIGAPLPDPIVAGKRGKRDEPASGILIFDRTGTERGGYITDDGAGNALMTLDDGKGEDQVTIVSYSERGAELGLRNHSATRFYVSALNDRTALRLQEGTNILLNEQSRK